jgi:hypothetical protein
MASIVYILSALTAGICAWLLLRAYTRTQVRLLLWSGLCFVCFCLNNLTLIIDLSVVPEVDLSLLRTLPNLVGICLLLYGFIWDAK